MPLLVQDPSGQWNRTPTIRDGYLVCRYRPRIEGLFSVIERWTRQSDGDTYWRSISKDNVTTYYGKTFESRIADPTGAGDAFRAGFLAGIGHGLGHEGAAQLGCAMAALVMETSGTQEYRFQREEFLARIGESYGAQVAAKMAASIGPVASSRAKEKV